MWNNNNVSLRLRTGMGRTAMWLAPFLTYMHIVCISVLQYQATDAPNNCRGLYIIIILSFSLWSLLCVRVCCCVLSAVVWAGLGGRGLLICLLWEAGVDGEWSLMLTHHHTLSCSSLFCVQGKVNKPNRKLVAGEYKTSLHPVSLFRSCLCVSACRCLFAAGCQGLHWYQKTRHQTPHWSKFYYQLLKMFLMCFVCFCCRASQTDFVSRPRSCFCTSSLYWLLSSSPWSHLPTRWRHTTTDSGSWTKASHPLPLSNSILLWYSSLLYHLRLHLRIFLNLL